jgi:hypothetical protein
MTIFSGKKIYTPKPKNYNCATHICGTKLLDDLSHFLPYPEDYIRHRISIFESFIDIVDDNTWLWKGSLIGGGYGGFSLACRYANKKQIRQSSHRFMYQIVNGKIHDNLHVMHKDNIKLNIHPSNLSLGTHQDNMRNMREYGLLNGSLSEEIIKYIPELYLSGVSSQDIADKYGRNVITIRKILHGYSYTNISRTIITAYSKFRPISC